MKKNKISEKQLKEEERIYKIGYVDGFCTGSHVMLKKAKLLSEKLAKKSSSRERKFIFQLVKSIFGDFEKGI